MSKADRDDGGEPKKATANDLLATIRGTATPEQKKLVMDALEESYSEISELCREIEAWAKERFRIPQGPRPRPQSRAKERLDSVLEFVRQKRIENVFTEDEVATFTIAGPTAPDIQAPPTTPVECNAMVARILKAIEKAHPEMASELTKFRSDPRR